MKTKIRQCLCTDHKSTALDSVYYGMPILTPTEDMGLWKIKCPNCGRMGSFQYKSPYYAIKAWNKVMERGERKIFTDD